MLYPLIAHKYNKYTIWKHCMATIKIHIFLLLLRKLYSLHYNISYYAIIGYLKLLHAYILTDKETS